MAARLLAGWAQYDLACETRISSVAVYAFEHGWRLSEWIILSVREALGRPARIARQRAAANPSRLTPFLRTGAAATREGPCPGEPDLPRRAVGCLARLGQAAIPIIREGTLDSYSMGASHERNRLTGRRYNSRRRSVLDKDALGRVAARSRQSARRQVRQPRKSDRGGQKETHKKRSQDIQSAN
jgi:hypothetical protein